MKQKPNIKNDLKPLFYPDSIAHVGASAKEVVGRFNFSEYLLQMKYKGRIYPVNPKYDEICKLKCYPDLKSIPDNIDIAILAVSAKHCPAVLKDVPAGKIKFVVIHTSGFREINKQGLEDELIDLSEKKGFRIVGPNCMGVYSQQGRIGFWEDHHEFIDTPGTIGMVSQSGGHAINSIRGGFNVGTNFDKVVSLGNQIDLSINELLEYYIDDDSIKVIGLYVEDMGDGRRFLENLKRAAGEKPVVVWKGGISNVGKEASMTHTGSIAGNEKIFRSAMRQAGVIMPTDRTEFLQLIRLLQPQYDLPSENAAIISPGGGNTVSICDMFAKQRNLSLPRLSEETQERLRTILPEENVDIKNPVDSGGNGIAVLNDTVDIISDDPGIDSILILLEVDFLSLLDSHEKRVQILESIIDIFKQTNIKKGKPIHMLLIQHRQSNEKFDGFRRLFVEKYNEHDVPWISGSFEDAAIIYSKLVQYRKYLDMLKE